MSKIIFLDIDGVLNSNFWNETHQVKPNPVTGLTIEDVEESIRILLNYKNLT